MRRTLVVDDNAVNRKLAVALLKRRGWYTEEAENGAVAMQRLESGNFDSVLLDISMPVLDGEETCRRIRANPATAALRVVAYTAHAMESDRTRIMSAGFDDIVIKPITAQDLLRVMPD
ncbi:MAG: response regulator [Burkholderiales bacterium]|nr:response regulator [Burkholderiales bacterium]